MSTGKGFKVCYILFKAFQLRFDQKFGQGNFTFVREKSAKSQGISNSTGCGNHALASEQ